MVISFSHRLDYSVITFFAASSFLSLLITSLCWLSPLWYQAEIISLHLQALLEPIPTLPINLHSLSGGWLPPSSAISKHLCYFLPRLGRNSSLKKIAVLSPFLPALVLTKTFFCAGQAQILPLFCLTCCPPGWLKLPCALSCTPFLGLVFHMCVESKDCVFMRWAIQWGSQACDNHPWLIVLERAWAEGEEGRGRYIEFLRSSFPSL